MWEIIKEDLHTTYCDIGPQFGYCDNLYLPQKESSLNET